MGRLRGVAIAIRLRAMVVRVARICAVVLTIAGRIIEKVGPAIDAIVMLHDADWRVRPVGGARARPASVDFRLPRKIERVGTSMCVKSANALSAK